MSFSLKDALAGGGAAITVAAFLLGNLTGEVAEPVDNIVPNSPAAEVRNPCPNGWDYKPGADEHAIVKACERGKWVVILDSNDRFQHGFQLDDPGASFKFRPSEVPDWLR